MRRKSLSEEIWDTPEDTRIDGEIKRIVDECYAKARQMIREHEDVLHRCAELLLEKEKINRDEFEALFEEKTVEASAE